MDGLTHVQAIELFHVAFLEALSRRVDRARFVLKGGANLRYFFGSLRYSEDIDLDLVGEAPWSLAEQVERVLEGGPLPTLLATRGLQIVDSRSHKQTETTPRWKLAIESQSMAAAVPTKVEFSLRGSDDRYQLEAIPARIVEPYALRPPTVQHYTAPATIEQKVAALAGRPETQARDVFDLELLLRGRTLRRGAAPPELLRAAAARALELPYSAFRDQVLAFLEPEAVELYERREDWEAMQLAVADRLEEAAR